MEYMQSISVATRLLRLLAWFLIAAIVALSLVPPFFRPVTGAPHNLEHASIFMLTGLVFGFAYRSRYLYQLMGFVVFTAAIEVAQLAVPGRHTRIDDFIVDAASACAGVLVAFLFVKAARTRPSVT
jgi:VanZ family protein